MKPLAALESNTHLVADRPRTRAGRAVLARPGAYLRLSMQPWSLVWVLLFSHAPKPVGLVGPFVAAVALLCALGRMHRALWVNHRYRFTTWRWGRVVAALLLMGMVMKLMLLA